MASLTDLIIELNNRLKQNRVKEKLKRIYRLSLIHYLTPSIGFDKKI